MVAWKHNEGTRYAQGEAPRVKRTARCDIGTFASHLNGRSDDIRVGGGNGIN